jgi:HAD superfamily hydrolase (TIGR01509 family)
LAFSIKSQGEAVDARHFLFDFDGTLVDSAPLHEQAFKRALAAATPQSLIGFSYSELRGIPTRDVFLRLGINDLKLLDLCVEHKQRFYRSAIRAGRLVAFPHARALLLAVLELGGDNYLVTSGSAESVNFALVQSDLVALFAGIVTADDVAAGKPAADPYLKCLDEFGLCAARSIAIEDAHAGVLSAKASGLRVIGVHDSAIAGCVDFYFPTLLALGDALREGGDLHHIHFDSGSPGHRRSEDRES